VTRFNQFTHELHKQAPTVIHQYGFRAFVLLTQTLSPLFHCFKPVVQLTI